MDPLPDCRYVGSFTEGFRLNVDLVRAGSEGVRLGSIDFQIAHAEVGIALHVDDGRDGLVRAVLCVSSGHFVSSFDCQGLAIFVLDIVVRVYFVV